MEPNLQYNKPYGQDDSCDLNPEFAVICSFIVQFGDKIDLVLDIEQLKTSIEDQSQLDESLIDLHVKLLKKVRRYFVRDQWEKALIRFASEYSYEDAYEIERLGYLKTRPSIKLQLLRRLLDAQFECDQKFKASVNLCEANELRVTPIGRDIRGNTYWQRTDNEGNLRIFQEQPLDYKYWKTVCTNPEELNYLIDELDKSKEEKVKGEPILEPYNPLPQIFPEFFCKKEKLEEEVVSQNEKKVTKSRKGRNRGRGKKSSPLPVLKETEEENSNNGSRIHDTSGHTIKDEIKPISDSTPNQLKPNVLLDFGSVESQVKKTLENLLDKVVSSFEYILRPLSRNSSENVNEEPVKNNKTRKKPITRREKTKEDVLPRRASSRIQQLQLKKVAEQEEAIKRLIECSSNNKSSFVPSSLDDDSRSRSTSSRNNHKRSESPEDGFKNGKNKRKEKQTWRRGKGKKKLSWDKDDSDVTSTSSLTESNDDEFEDHDDSFKFETNNYDDEFACEEEETNIEPVIIKRARTARQSMGIDEQGEDNANSTQEEDKPCGRCDKSNDPEWILLCDMCDDGYHTSCCLPPLMVVPDGDWFCPPCEHKMLLTKLRELYTNITELLIAKERERQKKQRIRQNNIKKEPIKTENQVELPEKRKRLFVELNDPIALQTLDQDLEESSDGKSSGSFRGRPRNKARKGSKKTRRRPRYEDEDDFKLNFKKSRKTYLRRNLTDSDESEAESTDQLSESSEEDIKPKTRRARASVSYRFQEYDELIKSAIQGESGDDNSSEKESIPDSCNYGRGKDMAAIEALAYQQENGFVDQNGPAAVDDSNVLKQKTKKKSRRLNDLDAASETENATSDESFQASSATEAEDEDDDITEADDDSDTSIDELVMTKYSSSKRKKGKKRTSYDSDDSEYAPTRSRRAASMRVSYKESSDDEDADLILTTKKAKKNTLSSGEESQASWKSPVQSIIDDDRSTSCEDSPNLKIADPENTDQVLLNEESVSELVDKEPQTPEKPLVDANMKTKKVKLERQEYTTKVTPHCNSSLNESIDEIAAPLYSCKPESTPLQYPTTPINRGMQEKPVLAKEVHVEKFRDPIQELNQYCSESANSATMFNSYNETLSTKNHVDSLAHPPFYDEEVVKPSSSIDKPKRVKKVKTTPVKPSETILRDTIIKNSVPVMENTRAPLNAPTNPTSVQERVPVPQQQSSPSLRQTIRPPLMSTPPRFHHSSPPAPGQVYSVHPTPLNYPISQFTTKYTQQPPQPPSSQTMHHYPHAYENPINNFIQQPRSSIPISPYSNSHLQSGMWNQSPVSRAPPRQIVPSIYYTSAGTMPNPNFSIHQLLGNPYSITGLATLPNMPNLSQPPSSIHSSLTTSQQTPSSTQSTNPDNSTIDSQSNTDKDMIRGMSDVISFIGDT